MSPYEYGLLDAMKRERDPVTYDINLWFRPKVKPVEKKVIQEKQCS